MIFDFKNIRKRGFKIFSIAYSFTISKALRLNGPKTMKTSISQMAIMAEDASISGAPTSSPKWKKSMLFGGAILLLVLIPTIVFSMKLTSLKSSLNSYIAENQDQIKKMVTKNQDEIEKIATKLDTVKEEKEKTSSRLDLVLRAIRGDGKDQNCL